ncbi:putative Flp pilus-assembly TadE/G-like protein [Kribbella sp. VKM Ac-2527]|uniref:Putative Flp pilus-assembly TadE/G-like protein n=1 Tax=Kribbella caucasensis TaxID=2512215 RepID=A0A4R6KN08_9ACTN|nr:putative Flp pilus-assembly TadE/G-like protein [Kribbella sp. VKM Ac-2527]
MSASRAIRRSALRAGPHPHLPRERSERGSAVVEFSWLALLLLVPLIYVMLGVFDVQRASYGATAATRAAGRAFIIVPDGVSEEDARSRAFEAARLAMKDQGLELEPGQLKITCSPACLEPGSIVTVELDTEVPLPLIPDALGGERPAVQVSASHTEPFGDYREAKGDG